MKEILISLKHYFTETDKRIAILSTLFIAIAIFINYYYGLNFYILTLTEIQEFLCWYSIFLLAFSFAYLLQVVINKVEIFQNSKFIILLLIAPAIFAWKMAFTPYFSFSDNELQNEYWNYVFYWPFKVLVITVILFLIWRISEKEKGFYGLTTENFKIRPYLLILLFMVPLVAVAASQPDFQAMYPKLQEIKYLSSENNLTYVLLYEISYGSDFFSIELFFRGFLVLAFAKWAGKDAILPMALFYCTIHFGKPLGECISSFFGGLLLGVVVYHTRTIWGGLLVHVGIAWMMELAGYLASS